MSGCRKIESMPTALHLQDKAWALRCLSYRIKKNGREACSGGCKEERFCRKVWEKAIGG